MSTIRRQPKEIFHGALLQIVLPRCLREIIDRANLVAPKTASGLSFWIKDCVLSFLMQALVSFVWKHSIDAGLSCKQTVAEWAAYFHWTFWWHNSLCKEKSVVKVVLFLTTVYLLDWRRVNSMWHKSFAEYQWAWGLLVVFFSDWPSSDKFNLTVFVVQLFFRPSFHWNWYEAFLWLIRLCTGFSKCMWSGCFGVADHPWYRQWSKQVGCRSLEAFQTVLSYRGEWEFPACSVLASVQVFGIPTAIVYTYLATQGILFCRVKESSFLN